MLTLKTVLNCVQGWESPQLDVDQEVNTFSIDTRTLKPGDVFVALQGEKHHGNAFIPVAIQQGAIAVITDREPDSKDIPYILVEDSLTALRTIGVYQRSMFYGKVCGVTGSVGKTSVKEALSCVMRQMGVTVHASDKSYNNHIGVPLTLANMSESADIAVIEIGMNHPGEILELTQLVRPDVAIVTAVGPGHIEFFNSVEDIAKEKVSIAAALVDNGIAVVPADSEFFHLMERAVTRGYHRSVVSFGTAQQSNVRGLSVESQGSTLHVKASVFNDEVSYSLPTINYAWINNSLAILAAAHALGFDVKAAANYLAKLPKVDGRGRTYTVTIDGMQITLIDDAYNANPMSMKAALETLSRYDGRKVAVIGDMRELGKFGERYHQEIGQLCNNLKIDKVLTCGELMQHAYNELSEGQRLAHVADYTHVMGLLADQLHDGDVVLFKASNGVKLHKVVAEVLEV